MSKVKQSQSWDKKPKIQRAAFSAKTKLKRAALAPKIAPAPAMPSRKGNATAKQEFQNAYAAKE